MIATSMLAALVCLQSPDIPEVLKPGLPGEVKSKAPRKYSPQIGNVLTVGSSYVGLNLAGLNYLIHLTYHDRAPVEKRKAAIRALATHDIVVAFDEPARVIVQGVIPDNVYHDPSTKKPVVVYRGRVLDGYHNDKLVFFMSVQVTDDLDELEPPPGLDDPRRAVYKQMRTAFNVTGSRASGADLSIRASVLQRENDEAVRAVAKKNGLALGEMEEIIRLGEIDDGRAARRAQQVSRNAAKAQNMAMLSVIGQKLDQDMQQFLTRVDAESKVHRAYAGSFHLGPGVIIHGPLGHPLDHKTFVDGGASVRPLGK